MLGEVVPFYFLLSFSVFAFYGVIPKLRSEGAQERDLTIRPRRRERGEDKANREARRV
jgi:hypothetical protein